MADPGDDDPFGQGRAFSDSDDSADCSEDGDSPRRKRRKYVVHSVRGFPAARPGAGVVLPPESAGGSAAVGPSAPAAAALAAPAPPLPPPTDTGRRTTTGIVRQADGLQARFGHVMQAGSPTLHAHELAELRHIITEPPYYSPVKLAELLVRADTRVRAAACVI